jgi:23S rRNA U2552 (ribose-2'-O)-methylase RlmE/FtsJ
VGLTNRLRVAWRAMSRQPRQDIASFLFPTEGDARKDITTKYGFEGELLDFFVSGRRSFLVHKWHHYIPIYDRYFHIFRGRKVRFLEIGVSQGGSLEMWRHYFGPDAIIFGVDIDPACANYNDRFAQVRIGSQTNVNFLLSVVEEMGGVDVVLDDGSHHMSDILASLETLFPRLNRGGIYLIEDLHTAYWRKSGGGYASSKNFFNVVRDVVDDMHRWYHDRKIKRLGISEHCTGIHIHDSIVVFEKGAGHRPVHSRVGPT